MKRISTLCLVLMLASAGAAHAETRVFCPEGLKWSSEGECRVEFDRLPKPFLPLLKIIPEYLGIGSLNPILYIREPSGVFRRYTVAFYNLS